MTAHAILQDLADRLWEAGQNAQPMAPLVQHQPDATVADAYRIQTLNIERQLAGGARVVGHKIGLTSPAMQQMMGVDTPDFGHLLDTMLLEPELPVGLTGFIQPRLEPELAFRLARDLPTSGCTVADVRAATAAIAPCLELIDSRITDWQIGLVDTIADNASSAGYIVGQWQPLGPGYDTLSVTLFINDEEVEQGATSEVLGDPAAAVAWLANELGRHGTVIEAGHVVLSGSCTRARDVHPGDHVRATFGHLGEIIADFAEKSEA